MLLLLSVEARPIAIADTGGVGCDRAQIVATTPRPGQDAVPVDIHLAFGIEGTCAPPEGYQVALTDGEEEVGFWTFDWDERGSDGVYSWAPDTALVPDTEYSLVIEQINGFGESSTISFTAGSGTVAGLTGAPQVAITSAELDEDAGAITVYYTITPATDPQFLSILAIEGAGAATFSRVFSPFGVQERRDQVAGEAGELCLSAHEIDGLGVRTDGNTACVTLEGSACGCSSSTPTNPLLAAFVLGALVWRRHAIVRA